MVDALTEPHPLQRKPRRRWQFSLRTALVVMLVVGAALGLWARHDRIRRNRLALIEKYAGSRWLQFEAAFRDQAGRRLRVMVFSKPGFFEKAPADYSRLVIADDHFHELGSENVDGFLTSADLDDRRIVTFELNRTHDAYTWRFSVANGIRLIDVADRPPKAIK